jgi:CheY-like chemotaxis protein
MRRLRILVVEDDALQCMLLAELLTVLGHDVCGTAATEADAIAAGLSTMPDVMLVDANLRSGSGVSAVSAILRHTVMPHIYISGGGRIALPANTTVLQKPYDMADLKAALDSLAALVEGQGLREAPFPT